MSTTKTIHDDVTNSIIELIESNPDLPWNERWNSATCSNPYSPSNPVSGTRYSGVNVLILLLACIDRGYSHNQWMTYKQAQEAGYQVRKGSKSVSAIFYKALEKEDDNGESVIIPMVKSFALFNVADIDGFDLPEAPVKTNTFIESVAAIDSMIAKTGADIRHGGNRAYFNPASDHIQLPEKQDFKTTECYYATALHELAHWTGHKARLDRQGGKFASQEYAFEELVAELTAAFLCSDFGMLPITLPDHASYVQNWLQLLKADNRAIFRAAAAAQKAHDYIMSCNVLANAA